jgi:hypothetical protein
MFSVGSTTASSLRRFLEPFFRLLHDLLPIFRIKALQRVGGFGERCLAAKALTLLLRKLPGIEVESGETWVLSCLSSRSDMKRKLKRC